MGDLEHEYGRQWEAIAFYPGPDHAFVKRPVDVIRVPCVPPSELTHPNEKPVRLLTGLASSHYGDTILDPFMGSGTTLVAAKNLGRKAIGIEIELKYVKIAIERLEQEVLPLDVPQKIEKRHSGADSLLLPGMTTGAEDHEV